MGLNAKKQPMSGNGQKFKPQEVIDAGTYPARVAQVIDLGLQPQRPYQGTEKPPAHEIMLTWELVDEFMKDEEGEDIDDKPRWLSETFPLRNLNSDLAKSTKRYKALDPNEDCDGDFSLLIGAPGNVLVTTYQVKNGPNAGMERNKVQDVTAMRPKDVKNTPELQNEPKVFSLDEPDLTIFQSLPEWLQEKIKDNLEYAGSPLQALLEGGNGVGKGEAVKEPVEAPEAPAVDEDEEDEKPW